jgi:single-stranded-DNA-specific exonuclease
MSSNQSKRWLVKLPVTPEANEALAGFSPIMRQVLFNRGFATDSAARVYLRAEANFDSSPFQMTGIPATVERVRYALDHHEQIAIYGDYDVDGVSATALLVQTLRALGGNVRGKIPNRFDEGYGLNNEALSNLQGDGVKLVISVDCGIRSPDEAAHARAIGLDLIISDHHQPADGDLPPAFAIVNPKQAGDIYPDKDLAGVGVAYKIVQALLDSIGKAPDGFQPNPGPQGTEKTARDKTTGYILSRSSVGPASVPYHCNKHRLHTRAAP